MRPIVVGEVLRRIARKVVMYIAKKDVKDAAGSLQVWTAQEARSEAALHAIYDVYQQDETEAFLLVTLIMSSIRSIGRRCSIISLSLITTCL